MNINLVKSGLKEAETIHAMQIKSFMPLLSKYHDYETSPANESLERIISRINEANTDYYIIKNDTIAVGAIRIVMKDKKKYRVSSIFVLPEYQKKGIAQKVFQMIEQIYCDAKIWELDTVMQERGNCYLYEKLSYKQTGETKIINDKLTIVYYKKLV